MKNTITFAILLALPAVAPAAESADLDAMKKADIQALVPPVPDPSVPGMEKIVGGVEAVKGEFPFIVSLQSSWGGHFCGGSLIKKNWVLTAAHCIPGGIETVVIGLHDQSSQDVERLAVEKVIPHPDYNNKPQDFDFALIQLKGESKFSPVALNRAEIPAEAQMVTAGWGATSEGGGLANLLQKVTVPYVTADRCSKAYPGKITERMLCAGFDKGGKDSCQGDSGGPLVLGSGDQRVLAGVVSWGEGCARPNKYGVYSKVSSVLEWIEAFAK